MNELVYLDSSAIIKRYLMERGTEGVSGRYADALSGESRLCFSIWNVGEVLGVLDRASRLGRLSVEEYRLTRGRFLSELRRMVRLNVSMVVPFRFSILADAWRLVESLHIYQSDALQLATARSALATEFLTGDRMLHDVASGMGLNSVYLG